MGCSIGRRLIDYLRMFSRETGYDFECKLANILNKVWSENVMCLWRLNKKTSKLLGTEIKAFVLKCPDIVKLMRTKEGGFVQTQESIALARGLELWHHIEAHLKRAEVEKKRRRWFSKCTQTVRKKYRSILRLRHGDIFKWKMGERW